MNNSINRLVRFDIAKAICIVLVALGHFNPDYSPIWYKNFVEGFCSFHMPVFMFASGYLYLAFGKQISYKQFVLKKCHRLMLPYIVVSIIIISIKLISQNDLYVQHPVSYDAYLKIIYKPEAAYFLWFAWALFDIFLFIPFFNTKKKRFILFLISVVLHYIDWTLPEIFCLKEMQNQLIWFVLGLLCVDYGEKIKQMSNPKFIKVIADITFVILYICILYFGAEKMSIAKCLLSWFGIYVIMQISICLENKHECKFVNGMILLGVSSYIIYLFHTTFEGFVKSVIARYCTLSEFNNELFLVQAFAVTFIGVYIPFLLYNYFLKRYKITRYLFGM